MGRVAWFQYRKCLGSLFWFYAPIRRETVLAASIAVWAEAPDTPRFRHLPVQPGELELARGNEHIARSKKAPAQHWWRDA